MPAFVQVIADGHVPTYSVLGQRGVDWDTTGILATGDDASGPLLSMTTFNTFGAVAGLASTVPFYQRGWGGSITLKVSTSTSISDIRIVAGLSSVIAGKSETPITHMAAFVYDTGAHGTAFWRFITSDGSGTLTTTTTTESIATSTRYELRIDMSDSASVKGYVDGTLAATNTTNLPTSTEPMRVGVWVAEIDAGAFS